jgi:hypothetical protein
VRDVSAEAFSLSLRATLADARQVKNLPGRPKRDPSDPWRPTTSASSDPSASKSPSPAHPDPDQTDQNKHKPPDPYRPQTLPTLDGQGPLPPAQPGFYFRG